MNSKIINEKSQSQEKIILGHPRGLFVLFWVEMWERFSYYGMRALLVLYLTWHFLIETRHGYAIYATYVSLVYIVPLLGGYLADKYLGFRKAVIFGALLLSTGHALMGLHGSKAEEYLKVNENQYHISRSKLFDKKAKREITVDGEKYVLSSYVQPELGSKKRIIIYQDHQGGQQILKGTMVRKVSQKSLNILYLALALIAGGSGFLKPSMSGCVGALYRKKDIRRDSGFTLFYMGVNLGAALGAFVTGWLGFKYGWSYGFGAAAIGMLVGLFIFLVGQEWLEGKADPKDPGLLKEKIGFLNRETLIYGLGIAVVILMFFFLQFEGNQYVKIYGLRMTEWVLYSLTAIIALGLLLYIILKLQGEERGHMFLLMILTVTSVLFWTLFDQGPSSLNVFAVDYVSEDFLGFKLTAPQLQTLNPVFIIIFAPIMSILWLKLAKIGREPPVFLKFGTALILIGLGYWVLTTAIHTTGVDSKGNPLHIAIFWIGLMYLLHTLGELCLSPVGLSSVSKLSVPGLIGFMMGVWFLSTSVAQITAGTVATMTVVPEGTSLVKGLALYNKVYFNLGLVSIAIGAFMVVLTPVISKTIGKNAN